MREKNPVTLTDARVKRNGDYYPVSTTIFPVPEPRAANGLLLITFQEAECIPAPPRPPETVAEESAAQHLESELKATKEDLQGTIEELESSNEELKAANEEVMSMNEEFQSTNEELETSKEELQSLNEELNTVNNQLQDKVADLEVANNDLANLLNCTDVAILFLDDQFRIKSLHAARHPVIQFDCHRPQSAHQRHHAPVLRQHASTGGRTGTAHHDAPGEASPNSGRQFLEPTNLPVSDAGQAH